MIQLTPTVTLLELLWTFFAGVGFAVTAFQARAADQDLAFLRVSGQNGVRELVAIDNFRSDMAGSFAQFVFFLAGALAMLVPTARPATGVGVVFSFLFLAAEFMVAWAAVMRGRTRRRVILVLSQKGNDDDKLVK